MRPTPGTAGRPAPRPVLIGARALSDLSRTDLALEVIEGETGPDVERLRADILWAGRRWREAGEATKACSATSGGAPAPGRRGPRRVIRAAIA